MTRPVADNSVTIAADPGRSLFSRNRAQAPGGSETFGDAFSSLIAGDARSSRSRSTTEPVESAGNKLADGAPELAPRSHRSRAGGMPELTATPRGTNTGASGFVRSQSTVAPHLPRFESVPDTAKFPSGPYHQAPAEFGGEWWLVNPFTGSEPWLRVGLSQNPKTPETLPDGFAEIFGPRPTRQQYPDYFEFRLAKLEWEQDLKHFKRAGMPEGLDLARLGASEQAFREWGLGKPAFYEGGHGWRIAFPEGEVPGFEMNPQTALQAPHIVIAKYQIRMLQQGIVPETVHPWVPPHLLTPVAEEV